MPRAGEGLGEAKLWGPCLQEGGASLPFLGGQEAGRFSFPGFNRQQSHLLEPGPSLRYLVGITAQAQNECSPPQHPTTLQISKAIGSMMGNRKNLKTDYFTK